MPVPKTLFLAVLLSVTVSPAFAEDYKTPANMTAEDKSALLSGSSEYEQCVTARLREDESGIDDPRALADAAMDSCSEMLTAFAEKMAADNYHPDFSNYYLGKVKHRVANEALRQAMFIASQKPEGRE